MKTSAEIRTLLKGFYETNIQSLNGVLDKLPETLKGEFLKLRDTLNEQLSKLPPLEQVPAAQEAGWTMNSLGETLVRMQEYATGLIERLNRISTELSTRQTALQGFEEQVKKKDLLTKAEVENLCAEARQEGVKSVLPQIVALRKGQVELAGLPLPAEAEAQNKLLGAADFDARFAGAKDNLAALVKKGLKLGGRGDALVRNTVWLGAQEFAGQLGIYEGLISGGSETPRPEPLLGLKPGEPAPAKDPAGPRITIA